MCNLLHPFPRWKRPVDWVDLISWKKKKVFFFLIQENEKGGLTLQRWIKTTLGLKHQQNKGLQRLQYLVVHLSPSHFS